MMLDEITVDGVRDVEAGRGRCGATCRDGEHGRPPQTVASHDLRMMPLHEGREQTETQVTHATARGGPGKEVIVPTGRSAHGTDGSRSPSSWWSVVSSSTAP